MVALYLIFESAYGLQFRYIEDSVVASAEAYTYARWNYTYAFTLATQATTCVSCC